MEFKKFDKRKKKIHCKDNQHINPSALHKCILDMGWSTGYLTKDNEYLHLTYNKKKNHEHEDLPVCNQRMW